MSSFSLALMYVNEAFPILFYCLLKLKGCVAHYDSCICGQTRCQNANCMSHFIGGKCNNIKNLFSKLSNVMEEIHEDINRKIPSHIKKQVNLIKNSEIFHQSSIHTNVFRLFICLSNNFPVVQILGIKFCQKLHTKYFSGGA